MRKIFIFSLLFCFILAISPSCNAEKRDATQRRGLMMPRKSEIPRNMKKYKERERIYSRHP